MVFLSIYNAYILEGYKRQHNGEGSRKRDLSCKEVLCIQLSAPFTQVRKSTASNKRKRSADVPDLTRFTNMGAHFPFTGEGKDHWSVVCEKKHLLSKKRSPQNPSPRHTTTFKCGQCDVYLRTHVDFCAQF